MIARVRIAPVEQWCKWHAGRLNDKNMPLAQGLVGKEIEIITESMRPAKCDHDARMWDITESTHKWLTRMKVKPTSFGGICEHMLEMD